MARMDTGFIMIGRRTINGDIGQDVRLLGLWCKLIGWANISDRPVMRNGEQVIIKRGQLLTSFHELSAKTKLPLTTLRRMLRYLESTARIRITSDTQGTIISIVKYDEWYPHLMEEGSQVAHGRHTSGTRADHGRHSKKKNNKRRISNTRKNKKERADEDREPERTWYPTAEAFAEAISQYPKEEGIGPGAELFFEMATTPELFHEIRASFRGYAEKTKNQDKRKYLLNFLKQDFWRSFAKHSPPENQGQCGSQADVERPEDNGPLSPEAARKLIEDFERRGLAHLVKKKLREVAASVSHDPPKELQNV